ncbi:MAG: FG-GAP-like repeat-containing protein, partial [Myxococcota bacterium]
VFGADLDGDGDTDVLSASGDDGKVAWYENTDGLGTFGPQQVIATLSTATSVFGTDVDRDGDIDVLAIGGSKVVWYENTDGLGSFGPEQIVSSLIAFGTSVHGADFDRDGNIDVLSASGASDTIAWYENTNGLGSFGPQQVITALTDGPQSVFGIDVDGDGDADVLSASGNDVKIAWYENTDGLGTFGPQKVIALLTDRPHAVFGADLDGDGDTDVLSAEVGTDTIAWFEQTNVSNPLVSDTDGDGLLDGFEVNNGFDPLVPGEQSLDPDGDGLDNLAEQAAGADPLSSDTDGDGLLDGAEVNLHGTDPTNADTDGDGVDDGVEVAAGTNPLDPLSFPGFVIDFDAGVGSPITYSEQGVTFTALNAAPSAHLHLGNNRGDPSPDLLNHSGCCSTPYEITSIGNFCLLSLEVVGGTNPGTFTSDTATAVVVPNTVGTFNFPVGFCGVTFTWEQAAGDLAIDDLRAIDFATPGVPALGPWGLAIVALLISGLGISTLSMRRRRSSG